MWSMRGVIIILYLGKAQYWKIISYSASAIPIGSTKQPNRYMLVIGCEGQRLWWTPQIRLETRIDGRISMSNACLSLWRQSALINHYELDKLQHRTLQVTSDLDHQNEFFAAKAQGADSKQQKTIDLWKVKITRRALGAPWSSILCVALSADPVQAYGPKHWRSILSSIPDFIQKCMYAVYNYSLMFFYESSFSVDINKPSNGTEFRSILDFKKLSWKT